MTQQPWFCHFDREVYLAWQSLARYDSTDLIEKADATCSTPFGSKSVDASVDAFYGDYCNG